jgi:hypothetical protein
LVHVQQDLNSFEHTIKVVARDVEAPTACRSNAHEDCFVLRKEFVEADVATDATVQSNVDSEVDHRVDLALDQRTRQAVLGNAKHHHSTKPRFGFVDGDCMTGEPEIMRCGEAARASTDDCY